MEERPRETSEPREVIVVDIRMRFWSMVFFMVKWVLASIPALILLLIFWAVILAVLRGVFGVGMMWWGGRWS